jgi:hypothetical protein
VSSTSQRVSPSVPPVRKDRSRTLRLWAWMVTGFCAMLGTSLLALTFVHHRGVNLSGDEPSYVGEAYALGRLHTWNLGPAFASTGLHHLLGAYISLKEMVSNHGTQFPYHAIGLSAILAPSLALHNSLGALHLVLLAVLSALVIWLSVEVTRVTRAPRSWIWLVVVLFLAPGYLLATTQVYPDLISGLILAIVVMRLLNVERNGTSSIRSATITGALLFVFVWLDYKNIVIGIIVGAVVAIVMRRRSVPDRDVIVFAGLVLVGVGSVVAFNLYAYGHPFGPPQVLNPFSSDQMTKLVALIFDRRHGILVESPAAVLGIVGAARWRNRTPWSVAVGALAVTILLVANASSGGMTGGSFIGRYEWEALPLALAFGGLLLIESFHSRRRATAALFGGLFFLGLLESWAVFTSRPNAVSFSANAFDPAAYLGWWGRLDPSPILNYLNGEWSNARNLWGLGVLIALTLAAILSLTRLLGGTKRTTQVSVGALLVAVLCWIMTLTSPFLLPTPILYAASDLGPRPLPVPARAISIDGPGHEGTILSGPNLDVLPGRYSVTIVYRWTDAAPHSATFEVREVGVPGHSVVVNGRLLPPARSNQSKSVDLDVTVPGSISVLFTWRGTGRLTITSVRIAKVATCHVVECQGSWI